MFKQELFVFADETCFNVVVDGGGVVVSYGVDNKNLSTTCIMPFVAIMLDLIIFASMFCHFK